MPKRASQMILSEKEQEELVQIIKRHRSEQQVVLRARIVLAAAQGHANAQIARELQVNVDTVRLWRDRWVGLQGVDLETLSMSERLQDAPRPGAKLKFSQQQRCQIAALVCETPQESDRPISQWTGREIADELVVRGIVSAAQKGGLQPHRFRYWLTETPDVQREEKIIEGCEVYASTPPTGTTRGAYHQYG